MCGDGECTHTETPATCPTDCGCTLGGCCLQQALTLSLPADAYSGSLTVSDPMGGPGGNGYRYDDLEFQGTAGTTVVIETTAGSFDTYLYLLDDTCQVVALDDDGGTGLLSRITYTLPRTGVYTAVVSSYSPGTTGTYTVELNPAVPTCDVGTCCYGDTLTLSLPNGSYAGSLSSGDAQGGPRGSGYYFDDVEFTGTAGTTVVIETTSAVFDTYLYLLDEDCQVLTSDDDGGSGTLSRIVYTLPRSGVYTIVVTTFGAGETGSYTLELNPTGCSLGGCCYGDTLTLSLPSDSYAGSLSTGDAMGGPRGSEYYFDDIEFSGTAGTPVVIETTAASFDTYLYLLNEDCQVIASNDDGGSGLLSRIAITLPTTGVYTIVVTTYSSGVTGSYTVTLN